MAERITLDEHNKRTGLDIVKFMPHNFGGYSSAMFMTGFFLSWLLNSNSWLMGIISFLLMGAMFICALIFYARDNK